jgi:hypothetical protein
MSTQWDSDRSTLTIAVDFDGTCVDHLYPDIGRSVPHAVDSLREIARRGHRIILWTMRSGDELDRARQWFEEWCIPLHGVNENADQRTWTKSPKVYAHHYIDDAAVGCPLRENPRHGGRPYVDWQRVMEILFAKGIA